MSCYSWCVCYVLTVSEPYGIFGPILAMELMDSLHLPVATSQVPRRRVIESLNDAPGVLLGCQAKVVKTNCKALPTRSKRLDNILVDMRALSRYRGHCARRRAGQISEEGLKLDRNVRRRLTKRRQSTGASRKKKGVAVGAAEDAKTGTF